MEKLQALERLATERRKAQWEKIQSTEPVLAALFTDMARVFGKGGYRLLAFKPR